MQEIIQIFVDIGGNQSGADGLIVQVVRSGCLGKFNLLMSQKFWEQD
jgi:hypothetical protein